MGGWGCVVPRIQTIVGHQEAGGGKEEGVRGRGVRGRWWWWRRGDGGCVKDEGQDSEAWSG